MLSFFFTTFQKTFKIHHNNTPKNAHYPIIPVLTHICIYRFLRLPQWTEYITIDVDSTGIDDIFYYLCISLFINILYGFIKVTIDI